MSDLMKKENELTEDQGSKSGEMKISDESSADVAGGRSAVGPHKHIFVTDANGVTRCSICNAIGTGK